MRKIYTVILLALLAACASEPKQVETEEEVDSVYVEDSNVEESNAEEQMVKEFDYPVDSNNGALLVIPNEPIFEDDFNKIDKENVYGLFKGEKGYYIDKVNIEGKRVKDEYFENEYIQLIWENKDPCLFFVSGAPNMEKREVQAISIEKGEMPVGRTLDLEFNGKTHKLVASGTYKDGKESEFFDDMLSYRLMIFGDKNGEQIVDMLVAHDWFDTAAISLLFVGDIDGDGELDYLVETSRKYTSKSPALYLSKPAAKDALLKLIDVAGIPGGC
jgi:hypothetical protein